MDDSAQGASQSCSQALDCIGGHLKLRLELKVSLPNSSWSMSRVPYFIG